MKSPQGKGFFIWRIPNCEKGDAQRIADLAHEAQLTHVLIKVAESVHSYNVYEGVDLVPAVARKLQERGIEVWGWHYIRGENPIGEANKAIERVKTLQLDGYVLDAEGPYKQRGKAAPAKKFMDRLREGLPDTRITCIFIYDNCSDNSEQLIREYARERLEESGLDKEMRRGHADYFTVLAERLAPGRLYQLSFVRLFVPVPA